jgi:hypothetical protein
MLEKHPFEAPFGTQRKQGERADGGGGKLG